jgi:glycogen(starch) synthase
MIVGDGPERKKLEAIVQKEQLENVHFKGFLNAEAQAEIWADTQVTVIPSTWQEPFGMVALEAWSRGSAVIASACGGLDEIIDHGVTGWKFPMGDENALAGCLREALGHSDKCRELAVGGMRKLKGSYHREGWLNKMDAVLREAIEH